MVYIKLNFGNGHFETLNQKVIIFKKGETDPRLIYIFIAVSEEEIQSEELQFLENTIVFINFDPSSINI